MTVANTGNATATVSAVAITGDYTQTNNCGTLARRRDLYGQRHVPPHGDRHPHRHVDGHQQRLEPVADGGALRYRRAGQQRNLALNKATSESSHTQTTHRATRPTATQNTYWESNNNAFPQWVQVDLGSAQSVSRVVLKLPPATAWATRTETIALTGSLDGTTFTTLVATATYTFDPATGNTVTITFPAASARYLRVTITGNTGWPAGQLSEFEAYAS